MRVDPAPDDAWKGDAFESDLSTWRRTSAGGRLVEACPLSDARALQANLGVCMLPGNSASAKKKDHGALDVATQPNSAAQRTPRQ